MKTSSKVLLIILIVIFLLISIGITGLILYRYDKLFKWPEDSEEIQTGKGKGLTVKEKEAKDLDEETQKRIRELEEKIKELEEKQEVPFPDGDGFLPPLTQEQISAVVELWCPDDNNEYISIGSGSIVHSEGVIITNRHVVSNYDWSVIESSPTCYVAITENIAYRPEVK